MKNSHATKENLDLLYTLDRHDIDEESNIEDRRRMKKYMQGVLDEFLTERQRQIVLMHHGQGLSTYEIAQKLSLSPKSIQATLKEAMDKIQQHKKIFLKCLTKQ